MLPLQYWQDQPELTSCEVRGACARACVATHRGTHVALLQWGGAAVLHPSPGDQGWGDIPVEREPKVDLTASWGSSVALGLPEEITNT